MKSLEFLIPSNLATAIGETFMHSLWQLAGIAILMALVLAFVNRKASGLRYRIGIGSLALMALLPMLTFFMVFEPASSTTHAAVDGGLSAGINQFAFIPVAGAESTILEQIGVFFNENAYLIVGLWLLGALFFTLRFTGGYIQVLRLKRRNTSAVPAEFLYMTQRLAKRMGIRRTVQLLQSSSVDTPLVIGTLKPVILIPMGLLAGLTTEQVECVLAHELAHVRRWDFFVNILQSMVEITFFYHPAIWWVTKMVREERENCCDQVVVDLKENRLVYAKALLNLEVLRSKRPALAMGANGGKLFKRIQRITGGEVPSRRPQSRSLFFALVGLFFVLLLTTTGKEKLQASIPYFNFLPPEIQFVDDQTGEWGDEIAVEEETEDVNEEVLVTSDEEEVEEVEVFEEENAACETGYSWAFESDDEDGIIKVRTIPMGMHAEEDRGFVFKAVNFIQGLKNPGAVALDSPITQIVMVENGEEVKINFNGKGEISRVVKNGKELPSSDYPIYEAKVQRLMGGQAQQHRRHHASRPAPMPPVPDMKGKVPPMPPMPSLNLGHLKNMPTPPAPPASEDEAAMRKYEKEMERFEEEMEAWGEEFENKFNEEEWESYGEAMEVWGESFGESFNNEEWEEFGARMEAWGEELGAHFEDFGEDLARKLENMDIDIDIDEDFGREIEREVEREMRQMEREMERNRRDRDRDRADHYRDRAEEERDLADQYMTGMSRLKRSLDNDGLVDQGESFRLKINDDELYVNGDRQADSVHRKYRGIIESMGIDGRGSEWIEINYKKGKTKIEN